MRWMLCVLMVSAPLVAAAQPFEDLHASVAYRRQLVSLLSEQVIRQGWLDADDRAGEGGP